jgi:hypothetical protein
MPKRADRNNAPGPRGEEISVARPSTAFSLPDDKIALVKKSLDIIEACRSSSGVRAAYCRQINSMIETGRQDGTRSLINMLYQHHDRLAAYLFSATGLKFAVDFENEYPQQILDRAKIVARILGRDFERRNADVDFAMGVFEALKYGACIFKQWPQQEGPDRIPVFHHSLVQPWQFGVYNESIPDLSRQPAMVETVNLTLPEVWRRIYHLPNAQSLFNRIQQHATRGQSSDEYNSFFHQILSTSTLNTGNAGMTAPVPGGIVQLNNDPNYAIVGPEIAVDVVKMHELWLWDEQDYVTIQIVEPDILIAPLFRRTNLLAPGDLHTGLHPYTLIQPNKQAGYIWGRPEVVDLIEPQGLLSTWCDDVKRLFGLQIDKILAFNGDGVTDEMYDQSRAAGYFNLGPGGQVTDLTPKMPPESLTMLQFLMKTIDMIGGFDNILSGQGEAGVRAGNHASTLMKTASPRIKDRSLIVERQCAQAADLRLSLMEIKDARNYWTDPDKIEETSFLLTDLPEDRRVSVDGHSTSPIFQDDHQNLIAAAAKEGLVDGEYVLENLDFPNKDDAIRSFKKKQMNNAKDHAAIVAQLKSDPTALVSYLKNQKG